jgi:molybdopterin-containing oxidoreductase family membrane subunit
MFAIFFVSIFLNVGMFLERWMIVTPTLSLGYHPQAFNVMWPGWVEWAMVGGSFGWFGMLFLMFVKIFPCVSMYEVKEMVYHRKRTTYADVDEMMALHSGVPGPEPKPQQTGGA